MIIWLRMACLSENMCVCERKKGPFHLLFTLSPAACWVPLLHPSSSAKQLACRNDECCCHLIAIWIQFLNASAWFLVNPTLIWFWCNFMRSWCNVFPFICTCLPKQWNSSLSVCPKQLRAYYALHFPFSSPVKGEINVTADRDWMSFSHTVVPLMLTAIQNMQRAMIVLSCCSAALISSSGWEKDRATEVRKGHSRNCFLNSPVSASFCLTALLWVKFFQCTDMDS